MRGAAARRMVGPAVKQLENESAASLVAADRMHQARTAAQREIAAGDEASASCISAAMRGRVDRFSVHLEVQDIEHQAAEAVQGVVLGVTVAHRDNSLSTWWAC